MFLSSLCSGSSFVSLFFISFSLLSVFQLQYLSLLVALLQVVWFNMLIKILSYDHD
jgi:hypothetical protein